MWNCLTDDDRKLIKEIYEHFHSIYPDIDEKILYDRIFCGYCWGEGGLRITSIDDWDNVFNNGKFKGLFTEFDDWDDYLQYDGDYHKKNPFPMLKNKG